MTTYGTFSKATLNLDDFPYELIEIVLNFLIDPNEPWQHGSLRMVSRQFNKIYENRLKIQFARNPDCIKNYIYLALANYLIQTSWHKFALCELALSAHDEYLFYRECNKDEFIKFLNNLSTADQDLTILPERILHHNDLMEQKLPQAQFLKKIAEVTLSIGSLCIFFMLVAFATFGLLLSLTESIPKEYLTSGAILILLLTFIAIVMPLTLKSILSLSSISSYLAWKLPQKVCLYWVKDVEEYKNLLSCFGDRQDIDTFVSKWIGEYLPQDKLLEHFNKISNFFNVAQNTHKKKLFEPNLEQLEFLKDKDTELFLNRIDKFVRKLLKEKYNANNSNLTARYFTLERNHEKYKVNLVRSSNCIAQYLKFFSKKNTALSEQVAINIPSDLSLGINFRR